MSNKQLFSIVALLLLCVTMMIVIGIMEGRTYVHKQEAAKAKAEFQRELELEQMKVVGKMFNEGVSISELSGVGFITTNPRALEKAVSA